MKSNSTAGDTAAHDKTNSMEVKQIQTPLTDETIANLRCGEMVSISGVIFTARDAAHKLMVEALERGEDLPVDLAGQVIYYAGPTPAKPGRVIGSCGPTTSGRMDAYTPTLLKETGLRAMIGKGPRSEEVVQAMVECGAVYFAAVGGAAALIADSVKECDVLAFDDLGPEALRRLVVEDYPCVCVIDAQGNNLYELGPAQYREEAPC